jgi:CheY-like chemotaxis protein
MIGSCRLVCGVCEGLFHCKRLVELMHGAITVTSELDRGTTMSFTMRGKRLSSEDETVQRAVPAKRFESETVIINSQHSTLSPINSAGSSRSISSSSSSSSGSASSSSPKSTTGSPFRILVSVATPHGHHTTSRSRCRQPTAVWLIAGRFTVLCLFHCVSFSVEDNLVNRKLITRVLENEGHECATAEDGVQAMNMIDQYGLQYFHVVLMDLQMPVSVHLWYRTAAVCIVECHTMDSRVCVMACLVMLRLCGLHRQHMDGIEATRRIRALESERGIDVDHQLPIIALTGIVDPQQKDQAMQSGVSAFLSKPMKRLTLCALLAPLIDHQRSQAIA